MLLRTLRLYLLVAATLLVGLVMAQSPAPKSLVQVTDLLQVKQLSGVSIRPGGQEALVSVNNIEPEAESKWEYRYQNQLWLVPLGGKGKPRPLTGKDNAGQAAWSPDGQQIAFVRNADNKPQIFLLSLGGGEARQLTRFKYGASNPVWSPDGRKILFSASVGLKELAKDSSLNPGLGAPRWPLEKPGFPKNEQVLASNAAPNPNGSMAEIRAYLELNAQDRKAKVINKLNFQEEATTSGDLNFAHLFVVDAETGLSPKAVTKGFYRFGNAQFSPDGQSIVCTSNLDDSQHPDKALESQILWINLATGATKTLLGAPGKTFTSPKLSPSGKWLAFQQGSVSFVDVPQLLLMPINGDLSKATALPFDRNKGNLVWTAAEDALYFSAQSNGGAPIYRMDLKTKQAKALTPADGGVNSFDLAGNQLVFVQTRVENPFELYQSDAGGLNSQTISRFNADWVAQKQLSFPEKKSFVNEKGLTVEYWVMKPTRYVAGKKYPTILNIHGGPSAMWGPGESSMWHEFQYFCARGY
ncbi:MAG: S9 family peptidase, partial [Sphingobacteriia bacterium]